MSINLSRFLDIRNHMQAFSLGTIQNAGALLVWAKSGGYSPDEVIDFCKSAAIYGSIEHLVRLSDIADIPARQKIRKLEKMLPAELRRSARKARLEYEFVGSRGGRKSTCGCNKRKGLPEEVSEVLW